METIYESAVQKRNSSSSEEDLILNLSDKMVTLDKIQNNKFESINAKGRRNVTATVSTQPGLGQAGPSREQPEMMDPMN